MKIVKSLVGRKFGRLTVTAFSHHKKKAPYWIARCNCGNLRTIVANSLYSGQTQSCGCLNREINSKRAFKHGGARSLTYSTWQHMKARCNPNTKNEKHYKIYAGRGIQVCERWLNSYAAFVADMGERRSKEFSLDRIDNDKGYYKENCVWANTKDQARNKRNCKWVEYRGRLYSIPDLAEKFGLRPSTLSNRIKQKWDIEDAVHRLTQVRAIKK